MKDEIVTVPWQEIAKLQLEDFKQVVTVALEDDRCRSAWIEFLSTMTWVFLKVPVTKWALRMVPWMLEKGRGLGREK